MLDIFKEKINELEDIYEEIIQNKVQIDRVGRDEWFKDVEDRIRFNIYLICVREIQSESRKWERSNIQKEN